MRKNYVLDANILLHDPESIFHFADNHVIIPVAIIGEIDRFKKEMTDRGYNARAVVRILDALRGEKSLSAGVPLDNGGTLTVYCDTDHAAANGQPDGDREILRVAETVRKAEPDTPVVIVTKDINLRIRADAAGLRAEDYESDRVLLSELNTVERTLTLEADSFEALKVNGDLPLPDGDFTPNEYVLLRNGASERSTLLARVDPDVSRLQVLRAPDAGVCGIRPRNKEQYYAFDALLDERIQLVTLMGKAGTGKTLLAIAAALYNTLKRKRFRSVLVARPVVPLGRDIGYLPGDVDRKLAPWIKPIVDNIEFLLHAHGPVRGFSDCASLFQSGLLEIQPLTYIRGRSISQRFVVIDEAQNLTPLEVKTVITRIGEDAKVVLTGDPWQIDNPYVDATSNGFMYLAQRFRSEPLAAHVQLRKGERSPLAELAANLL